MKRLVSHRPSPALIVAVVAFVVAMVGTGYAAFKLPKKQRRHQADQEERRQRQQG